MEPATHTSRGTLDSPTLFWDTFRFLERPVAVGVGDEESRSAVHALLSGFGPAPAIEADDIPRFSFVRTAAGWQIEADSKLLDPIPDLLVALSNLEWHVVQGALARRSDLFQMHAGAVCLPSRRAGLVLAGHSTAGKSTLTLALMLRGFVPFSDDVTIVSPESLELMPFPRAFHIEDHTWKILEPIAGTLLRTDADMPAGYFCPPQWAHRPVPVRWIVFPQFEAGRTPALIPLPPSESVARIVEHSGSLHRDPRLALKTAARLAESVRSYRLEVGEIVESVALLQRLVNE